MKSKLRERQDIKISYTTESINLLNLIVCCLLKSNNFKKID